MTRFYPVAPQPQAQQDRPRLFVPPSGLQDVVTAAKPTFSSLNANVTAVSVSYGQTDILGTLKIAAYVLSFNTSAVIAAGTQLFVVTFAVPFSAAPTVVCGGGPQFVNALEAVSVSGVSFSVFNVNAVGNAAGQGMQFIAIGH